jgi:hypothetical protein
MGKLSTFEDM